MGLHARLRASGPCRCTDRFRSNAQGVLELGGGRVKGIPALAQWLRARSEQGLGSSQAEREEVEALLDLTFEAALANRAGLLRQVKQQEEAEQALAEQRQQELRQAVTEREQQRRAADPRAVALAAMERAGLAVPRPGPPSPPAAPMPITLSSTHRRAVPLASLSGPSTPSLEGSGHDTSTPRSPNQGRGRRASPGGRCGARLAKQIDAVLADIRAWDLVDPEPMKEFPWELAAATLKELQQEEESTPSPEPEMSGLDELIAEVQATPMPSGDPPASEAVPSSGPGGDEVEAVADAGAFRITAEPSAEPLPVQLPPEPEEWTSAWDALELSPRARALGELTAALRQTEAGQLVRISSDTAAAMFELLLNI